MGHRFLLLVLACLPLWCMAQTQDASAVYAEFSAQSNILRSAEPYSVEYENASKAMLRLYPQLQYHAAYFSQNNNANNALVFAQAYVDMAMMPQFEAMHLERSENYSTMTYFVASGYFNRKDYTTAIRYLRRYIQCGEQKNRNTVFLYLAKAQENIGNKGDQLATLDEALKEFPSDQNLLAMAINTCIESALYQDALTYINRALLIRPNDTKLTSLKGQCLEGQGLYEQAADLYALLAGQQKTLNIYKHYALNLYNCAVAYNATSEARSLEYFHKAIPILNQVVANDPTSVQYTTALAMAYLYTNQYDELATTNARLRAIGAEEVGTETTDDAMNLMASDLKRPVAARPAPSNPQTYPSPPATSSLSSAPKQPSSKSAMDFQPFVQEYVEREINQWQQKDPFETISEYTQRVTEETRNAKVQMLMAEAKRTYLEKYESQIRKSDFALQPYDAENSVFLINSRYGDIVLTVPRADNEARNFASGWSSVSVQNPELDIAGTELVIRSVDFVTNMGRVYHYSDQDEAKYTQADINLQFNQIDYAGLAQQTEGPKTKVQVQKQNVTVGESDVDINIPVTKNVRKTTFAFIIGNENYQSVSHVSYALHDAESMAIYCHKTLGLPESNIRTYKDATFGKILSCVREIKSISAAYNGEIDIIFYYAGHGVPDEKSKSAYLLPVDADGTQTETCYSISRLYQELGQLGANSVIVFMDACFSGAQRGEGMLASARGVALKTKNDTPQGKMITLSAATGEETAYPYEDKQHGMFTYFLMKHLQETKGKTNMGELVDYVQTQVRQQSVVVNHKSQTPTFNASADATDWRKWNWR